MEPSTQALVLVGGNASRLKRDGVEVPISKSFLLLAGRPLLFWNLRSLYLAGVRSLVIAGDKVQHLHTAKSIIQMMPYHFQSVVYFHDLGLGVHGLPYEARYLLDETFIFDCGHGLSAPTHYQSLIKAKNKNNVVFSAFTPHPNNPRQPVALGGSRVEIGGDKTGSRAALAHPIVADQAYARTLLPLQFNINNILMHYANKDQIQYVWSSLPPEFDIAEELFLAQGAYEEFLQTTAIIKR
jgi:hypothetical protein